MSSFAQCIVNIVFIYYSLLQKSKQLGHAKYLLLHCTSLYNASSIELGLNIGMWYVLTLQLIVNYMYNQHVQDVQMYYGVPLSPVVYKSTKWLYVGLGEFP